MYSNDGVISCTKKCGDCHDAPRHGVGGTLECRTMIVGSFNTPNDEGRFLHGIDGIHYDKNLQGKLAPVLVRMFSIPALAKESNVRLTQAVKCPPRGFVRMNDIRILEPSIQTARTCARTHLVHEIAHYKPQVILTLGMMAKLILIENLRYPAAENTTINSMMTSVLGSVFRAGRLVCAPDYNGKQDWEDIVSQEVNKAFQSDASMPHERLKEMKVL